jgi:glycosyltransferase involved in cell wall biosynthesis
MSAGLDYVTGDAVVIIDADLQDPPELIPDFIDAWKQGYDVVYGQRISRAGETFLKKVTAYCFYRIIRSVSQVDIPRDTGDFRLLSRTAVDSLKQLKEHHRFLKGLYAWIGFKQKAIRYHRDPRFTGQTKWNYWKLWNFAIEGITSFSIGPLKISSYLGLFIAVGAFLYGIVIIIKTLLYNDPVKGYPSLMTVILFLGGMQLLVLGIIGEYIGRIYNETKRRPLYFVEQYFPSRNKIHNSS